METIFNKNFYEKIKLSNSDEIIEIINTIDDDTDHSDYFSWGTMSRSQKVKLKTTFWEKRFLPELKNFISNFTKDFVPIYISKPWLNIYKEGMFQEVHDHAANDFAAVFTVNTGENFADFYFSDSTSAFLNPKQRKIFRYGETKKVKTEPGDLIIFPGYISHGVTIHNSSIPRKTLSFNFDIDLDTNISQQKPFR